MLNDEEDEDDHGRDGGPDDLDRVVAVELRRERVVAGLASIADDRVEDEALDSDEDDGGQDEDDQVEVEDVLGRPRSLGSGGSSSSPAGRRAAGGSGAEDVRSPGSGRRSLHQLVSRLLG